jgi:hypothetical protein
MRILLPFLCAAAAVAQVNENYTAYSIDALHGSYGHWAFFGALPTGASDECRAQMLIPAAYLPAAGGVIAAIEVSPHVEGTVTYQQLDLQLGSTALTALTTDMDANLPAPQTVYSASPGTAIAWLNRTQWTRIALPTPFVYQAGTNLVFESRRVIQRPPTPAITVSHQHSYSPSRSDLPRPVWAEGGPGSGSASARFGSYGGAHVLIRLVFAGSPTLSINGPRVNGSYYRLGQSLTVTAQGNPGDVVADVVDVGLTPSPNVYPPVQGVYFLAGFNLFLVGVLDTNGLGSVVINIPSNAALAGTHVYFQSAVGSTTFTWTNVVDAILQPL